MHIYQYCTVNNRAKMNIEFVEDNKLQGYVVFDCVMTVLHVHEKMEQSHQMGECSQLTAFDS